MKNCFKKIFCTLLTCCLLLSLAACGNGNSTNTDNLSVSNSADAENNAKGGDIVHIKTPEDLLALAERVNNSEKNVSAVLDADINMSGICGPSVGNWTPIKSMEGDFDGNGHKISNLYCVQSDSAAPFTDFRGSIKNLEIADVVMESTEGKAAGLLTGFGGNGGVIENCRVSGSVKGYKEAGGITTYIGKNSIVNSVNEAYVEAGYYEKARLHGYAGGIISSQTSGVAQDSGTIRGCVNKGEINATGKYAGGIIGYCSDKVCIEDCVNEGNVHVGLDDFVGDNYIGGIAGNVGETTLINRCINTGEISGNDKVGGIAGFSNYAIINCANHGNVNATSFNAAYGIVSNAKIGFVNCYNTGKITTTAYAVGLGNSSSCVEANLYNYGTVTYSSDKYINLTDAVSWGDYALMNVWSRKGCVISAEDHDSDQEKYGTLETEFKDGTVLNELNSAVENINSSTFTQYDETVKMYLEKFKEECDYEMSTWVAGSDGLPKFEWE